MRAFRALALVAVAVLCLCGALAAWRIAQLAGAAARQLGEIAASVNVTATQGAATLQALQDEIPRLQASVQAATQSVAGTARSARGIATELHAELPPISARVKDDLEETHRLILESGLTAMEARKASAEERAALPGLTAHVNESLSGLNSEMGALQRTTRDLDSLVNDPANAQTLKSLSAGTASLAATAQDGQRYVHGLLHPAWPHKVWGVMLDVAHVFNPL